MSARVVVALSLASLVAHEACLEVSASVKQTRGEARVTRVRVADGDGAADARPVYQERVEGHREDYERSAKASDALPVGLASLVFAGAFFIGLAFVNSFRGVE
ncbi:MAG: hypothetical protein U1F43_28035 [Myxococcota bacterium]